MKVICKQCGQEWHEGGNLTKQILTDFARGHALNHRHIVSVVPEQPQGETKQGRNEQPHTNS